jgi:hypothetical protein
MLARRLRAVKGYTDGRAEQAAAGVLFVAMRTPEWLA